jgi:hypothetical protein
MAERVNGGEAVATSPMSQASFDPFKRATCQKLLKIRTRQFPPVVGVRCRLFREDIPLVHEQQINACRST